jgi:uncharacterized protein
VKREWQDCPIDPSWITCGKPVTEISHVANNGPLSVGYWRCSEGEFTWHYEVDETIVILKGVAHINGLRYTVGDSLEFLRGTSAKWQIEAPVTKLYVIQRKATLAHRVARRLVRVFA